VQAFWETSEAEFEMMPQEYYTPSNVCILLEMMLARARPAGCEGLVMLSSGAEVDLDQVLARAGAGECRCEGREGLCPACHRFKNPVFLTVTTPSGAGTLHPGHFQLLSALLRLSCSLGFMGSIAKRSQYFVGFED
jgi:hypothetical protein